MYLLIHCSCLPFSPQRYQKQRKLLRRDWFWRHSYWSLWILMHQFFMSPFLKEGRINVLYIYVFMCIDIHVCIYMSILVVLCLKMGTKGYLTKLGLATFTSYEKISGLSKACFWMEEHDIEYCLVPLLSRELFWNATISVFFLK